jgi:hypothetical protein
VTGPALTRVALTDAGTARLEQYRQTVLGLPAAQFTALCRRVGVDDPHPSGGTALPR